jgi:hypothetical protein
MARPAGTHVVFPTAISLMARAGMKAELIAKRVGHNDGGALIYRRYRHLFPSDVREAVSMLDRMVAGTAKTPNSEARRVVNRWSADASAPRKFAWLSGRIEWAVLGSNQ